MNSVSIPWIASARKASHALVALVLVSVGCDDGGGSASDTDATTMPTTNDTSSATEDTTDGTDATSDGTDATSAPTTTDTTGGVAVDYAADIQPIWDANCTTGCHTAGGTAATWFLITPDVSYDSIVDKPSISFGSLTLITPGDRDASYLWHKINNTHFEAGGGGTAMPPPPATALGSADLDKIGAWIDAGAPE